MVVVRNVEGPAGPINERLSGDELSADETSYMRNCLIIIRKDEVADALFNFKEDGTVVVKLDGYVLFPREVFGPQFEKDFLDLPEADSYKRVPFFDGSKDADVLEHFAERGIDVDSGRNN
jgi:hypothetical protein